MHLRHESNRKQKNTPYNNIELRSPKVRELLGDIPQPLQICGMVIIVTILIIILTAYVLYLIHNPNSRGVNMQCAVFNRIIR